MRVRECGYIRCDDRDKPKLEIENATIFPYLHYYQMDLDSLIRTHMLTLNTISEEGEREREREREKILSLRIHWVFAMLCDREYIPSKRDNERDSEIRIQIVRDHFVSSAIESRIEDKNITTTCSNAYGHFMVEYIAFEPPNLLISRLLRQKRAHTHTSQ